MTTLTEPRYIHNVKAGVSAGVQYDEHRGSVLLAFAVQGRDDPHFVKERARQVINGRLKTKPYVFNVGDWNWYKKFMKSLHFWLKEAGVPDHHRKAVTWQQIILKYQREDSRRFSARGWGSYVR